MPPETARRAALKLAASAILGSLIPATAHPIAIALTGFVPALWLSQDHCGWAFASSAAYYLAAIWPVVPVAYRFDGSWLIGFAIWAGAALLLASPWPLFRPRTPKHALWCGPAAILLTVVPPLGIISAACPLSAAGYLFPGMKIIGLIAALVLPGAVIWRPRLTWLIAAALILSANLHFALNRPAKLDWEGVNMVADFTPEAFGDYQRMEAIFDRAEGSRAKVFVFPEATIRSWTTTTASFFDDRIRALRHEQKTVLVGAIAPCGPDYCNVVEMIGLNSGFINQRVPVPLGMWRPFRPGVPMRPISNGALQIGNRRVALLICYEQLIAWPAIVSTFDLPSVALGLANGLWVRETPISTLQTNYMLGWSRLWGASVVTATAH
jgi:hypothetical protein